MKYAAKTSFAIDGLVSTVLNASPSPTPSYCACRTMSSTRSPTTTATSATTAATTGRRFQVARTRLIENDTR